jgi:hypothetical protein
MFQTPPILPLGTQVVTLAAVKGQGGEVLQPRGAVGVVVKAPLDGTHSHRVKFPDGSELALARTDLAVRKDFQRQEGIGAGAALDELDLRSRVIYRCVVGSRAYGLDHDASDVDRRGIYLPPADLHWSLFGVPEQLEDDAPQECYWELQKFLVLALKANPNVLECLYTPLIEHAQPLAQEMLGLRAAFLSRLIYQTFNGYVLSQFKKLETDIRLKGAPKWKHAMHLVRLLLSGKAALREGHVPVHVGEHRERLLAIRRGDVPWEELNAWRLALHKELDLAYAESTLPERPDYERVNAFLIKARRSAL